MNELAGSSPSRLHRLTQPDWCNAPQPGNWANACMRAPGHEGDHAVRKSYRMTEAFYWPAHGSYPVKWRQANAFPDLWGKEYVMSDLLRSDAIAGAFNQQRFDPATSQPAVHDANNDDQPRALTAKSSPTDTHTHGPV